LQGQSSVPLLAGQQEQTTNLDSSLTSGALVVGKGYCAMIRVR